MKVAQLIVVLLFVVVMFIMQKLDDDVLNASLEQSPAPSESAASIHP